MITRRAGQILDALGPAPYLRRRAVSAGIDPKALDELVVAGLVVTPFHGVQLRADVPDTPEVRATAARLILPEGAALCRGTAAWVRGVDARPPGSHREPPPLECAVPRNVVPVRRAGLRCYSTDLADEDVEEVSGLACTTASRTAIDLARWSSPGMGLAILDHMARRQLIVPDELLLMVERWAGDRYIGQARRLITLCDPAAESYGESWMRLRFHDAGFPPPELQISLTDADGTELRRLDMGYREKRYAWEYDGEEHHAGLHAEARDRLRREQIDRRWGWTVIGIGKNLVLGPSMALEYGIGEIVGMRPLIRRRTW